MAKLYEIAQMKNGQIVQRGGIAASRSTVGRWITVCKKSEPGTEFVAVPASAEAVTISEYRKECALYAED